MKKLIISALLFVGIALNAGAAQQPARGRGSTTQTAQVAASAPATAARSAVRGTNVGAPATQQVRSAVSARSATTPTKTVAARAATTQKVISSGTKIAAATKNTAVSEECQEKYFGCMDAFCMLDNTSGGRCICSDRNAELDAVLEEIDALDQQSYQMATLGVEQIEMGENADAAIAKANAVADAQTATNISTRKTARKSLDLSMWNNVADFDLDDDIFSETNMTQVNLNDKTGDALHRAAAELCVAQMPECGSDLSMLQLVYAQRIKSDCSAYENSLKQRKSESQNKLSTAQRALREAALEQLQAANKYDLGQCTIEFKKCMQRTAGCGEDFSGCASVSAMDNTNVNKSTSKNAKKYSIKGSATTIEIYASTYDTLLAKKPLCETVTKSCVAVADKVWDTFLKEVAPAVKSAELIAEDNARQNCIGNISSCFQKACKDNIDPNDPEGSYDMCLTRPETMLNVCKIPLNACGINASSAQMAEQSQIWGFVLARLAAMRVDSCTKEVKECLQSEDRCGSDYTQCVGLDTDTIVRMCPYDKLVGCQQKYGSSEIMGDAVYDELARLVQGIFLNIDNNMLTMCQNAANEAMVRVCGDTENCDSLTVDSGIGSRSLEYKLCQYDSNGNIDYNKCWPNLDAISDDVLAGTKSDSGTRSASTPIAAAITGMVYWDTIADYSTDSMSAAGNKIKNSEDVAYELLDGDTYIAKIEDTTGMKFSDAEKSDMKSKVGPEIRAVQQSINNAIAMIEADPTVQFCMYGREVQGMKTSSGTRQTIGSKSDARFPELTKQMRSLIAQSALKQAKENYYAKYDELNKQMLTDYAKYGERLAQIRKEDSLDARRENARISCLAYADSSIMATSPNPPKNAAGQIIGAVLKTASTVAMALGGGAIVNNIASGIGGAISGNVGNIITGVLKTATASSAVTGTLAGGIAGASVSFDESGGNNGDAKTDCDTSEGRYICRSQVNQWNYKETITTTFEYETLQCHKCVRSQNCTNTRNPLFGGKWCKDWADAVEVCTDTQF